MSQAVGWKIKLRNTFLDFDWKKIKRIILMIFLLQGIMFSYLYVVNRNPLELVGNTDLALGPVKEPRYLFSIYGPSEKEGLVKPMDVTVWGKRIYVTDTGNQRVQVFDYNGNFLFMFGKYGTGKGQFRFPYGIAADASGKIYVADMYNGNISVFSPDGQFLHYFGNSIEIKSPTGLFIEGNRLYVADNALNKIKVFSLQDGKKLLEFGETGTGKGEFQSPNAVWVAENRIFVSDTGNDRVQVFNKLGNFLMVLNDTDDDGGGLFVNPRGVAVDGRNTVYVVNNLTHEVFGFDMKSGQKIFTFGSMGSDAGQFYLPNGIFIDDQGRIYITDTVNQRVNVFAN
ncbi:6-bladed beta-propeller [Calderihabitans maritimus]|uniref:6-bladed beta-propeller n=1 Tax=Calderihabitans maritimus TaxID=1246530 RepID=UPI001865020D|nr:6-bladed beta-propeller [Calderihabitans maritimus]